MLSLTDTEVRLTFLMFSVSSRLTKVSHLQRKWLLWVMKKIYPPEVIWRLVSDTVCSLVKVGSWYVYLHIAFKQALSLRIELRDQKDVTRTARKPQVFYYSLAWRDFRLLWQPVLAVGLLHYLLIFWIVSFCIFICNPCQSLPLSFFQFSIYVLGVFLCFSLRLTFYGFPLSQDYQCSTLTF